MKNQAEQSCSKVYLKNKMKTIGNIDLELAQHYAKLLDEGVLQTEMGSRYEVAFTGAHALGYSRIKENAGEELVNEYEVARGLENIGLNVPKIHGVVLESMFDFPFNIMDARTIRKPKPTERANAMRQYKEQINLAKSQGYIPGDSCFDEDTSEKSHDSNWGLDADGNVIIYDLKDWSKE